VNNLSTFLLVSCLSSYTSLQQINSFPLLVLVIGISNFAFSYIGTSPKRQCYWHRSRLQKPHRFRRYKTGRTQKTKKRGDTSKRWHLCKQNY